MPRRPLYFVFVFTMVALAGFTRTTPSRAESANRPRLAGSPFDLINAVNTLRMSYGLAPYNINSILMETAQAQADFMAETEDVTHTGPDGIGLTDRLLDAGYPLAGDLSAGGFRAENITSGLENKSAQSAVDDWTSDALHVNTMISPNLSEIGAGVAVANGRVYYVIDCALPTTVAVSESTVLSPEQRISIPVVSTPNFYGDVIHEVQAGQSLWQIAMAYKVEIDDIKRLNNLFDDNIYPGYKLLIKRDVVPSTAISTSPIPNLLPTVTIIYEPSAEPIRDTSILRIVLGIITLALVGGGVFTWLGSKKKTQR